MTLHKILENLLISGYALNQGDIGYEGPEAKHAIKEIEAQILGLLPREHQDYEYDENKKRFVNRNPDEVRGWNACRADITKRFKGKV